MKYDILLYEAGIVILILALVFLALTLKNLTAVLKKRNIIWLLPALAGVVLAAALGAHAYANFKLLPELTAKISEISSSALFSDPVKMESAKASLQALKIQLINLKAISFTCFLLSSIMLLVSTSVYMRWISK